MKTHSITRTEASNIINELREALASDRSPAGRGAGTALARCNIHATFLRKREKTMQYQGSTTGRWSGFKPGFHEVRLAGFKRVLEPAGAWSTWALYIQTDAPLGEEPRYDWLRMGSCSGR